MRYALLLLLCFATGCYDYQFDLHQPVSAHIGEDEFTSLKFPPLDYDLITDDGQLVMEIHNTSDAMITLVPNQSYLVDPNSRTRLVWPFSIAPQSYAKLIFPPPVPEVLTGQGWHYQMGMETAGGFHRHESMVGGMYYDPGYYRPMANPDPNYFWDWDTGPVKFHFVFSDGSKTYTNDLVIERVRM